MSATAFEASVNLAKMSIGCGILALPFSSNQCGIILALLLNLIIAVMNGVAAGMIVECRKVADFSKIPQGISSVYAKLSYAAFGWFGVYVTDLSLILTLVGVCVTYQITFAQLLAGLQGIPLSSTELTIFSAMIIYPLSCAKNVTALSFVSLLGIFFLSLSVIAILYFGIINLTSSKNPSTIGDGEVSFPWWPSSTSGFFSYIGVASFCYAVCTLVFPIEDSLKEKDKIHVALFYSLGFCWLVYAILSGTGVLYLYSTTAVQSNILLNLPTDSILGIIVRLSMAMVCILSPPLTLIIPAEIIERYLAGKYSFLRSHSSNQLYSEVPTSYSALEIETPTTLSREGPNVSINDLGRFFNRFCMVSIATMIAVTVPCFGAVISILGSCTVAMLSFVLPAALHWIIVTRPATLQSDRQYTYDSFHKGTLDFVILGLGSFICIFSTTWTILGIYDQITSTGSC